MVHRAPSVPMGGSYAGGLQGLAAYRTLATARHDLPEAAGLNAAGQSDSAGFGLIATRENCASVCCARQAVTRGSRNLR